MLYDYVRYLFYVLLIDLGISPFISLLIPLINTLYFNDCSYLWLVVVREDHGLILSLIHAYGGS